MRVKTRKGRKAKMTEANSEYKQAEKQQDKYTRNRYPPSNIPEYMWERSADTGPFSVITVKFSKKGSESCFKYKLKVLKKWDQIELISCVSPLTTGKCMYVCTEVEIHLWKAVKYNFSVYFWEVVAL